MKLTDGEKIIIALLVDIHRATKIDSSLNLDLVMESISDGRLWALEKKYYSLLGAEEDAIADVNEVADILEMWERLERSYSKLPEKEKSRIKDANDGREPKFAGFDANNDAHYGIAHHWIVSMGRFEHFRDRDLNSHDISSLSRYREMRAVFSRTCSRFGGAMTVNQIIEVVAAG